MRRLPLLAAMVLGLSACAGGPEPAAPTARSPSSVPPPAPPAPNLPPAPISVPPPSPADQCGAGELADLVGRPRTEIPVPVNPARRRVVCTTCPRTMDYSPYRLTIEYDASTGRVTSVGCG